MSKTNIKKLEDEKKLAWAKYFKELEEKNEIIDKFNMLPTILMEKLPWEKLDIIYERGEKWINIIWEIVKSLMCKGANMSQYTRVNNGYGTPYLTLKEVIIQRIGKKEWIEIFEKIVNETKPRCFGGYCKHYSTTSPQYCEIHEKRSTNLELGTTHCLHYKKTKQGVIRCSNLLR